MKSEEHKILNDSLIKLFKLDQEKIASLYNEAGDLVNFSVVEDADTERVSKFRKDSDSQFKRGVKETMGKFEKEVKEKYELESELVGVDLIDQLVVKKVEEAKTSSTKDITKHPDYIKLQLDHEKKLKEKDKELELKLADKEREYNKTKLFEKVRDRALISLEGRKPILSSDPRKAQVWRETYLNDLRSANYMENNGEIVVLNAEGETLKDTHGHPITFEEFEKEIADKYFDYPKAEERSSPGLKDEKKKDNTSGFIPPKDEDEYIARLKEPKITPTERIQLTEFWNLKK